MRADAQNDQVSARRHVGWQAVGGQMPDEDGSGTIADHRIRPVDGGVGGRGSRWVVAAATVGAWVALGFWWRLRADVYLLIGIPITGAFQLMVVRRPLRAVWVGDAPKFIADARALAVFALLAIVPVCSAVASARQAKWVEFAYSVAAIGGAVGAAYALRAARRVTLRQLGVCVLTACSIGVGLTVLSGWAGGALHPAPLGRSLLDAGYWFLLYLPAVFVLEEVFFRGVLDTYLHGADRGSGWTSATFVSGLWGLWHLPVVSAGRRSVLVVAVGLLVVQIAVGIPLSFGWRRSGNLAVPGIAHALNDAVRNVLVGIP